MGRVKKAKNFKERKDASGVIKKHWKGFVKQVLEPRKEIQRYEDAVTTV